MTLTKSGRVSAPKAILNQGQQEAVDGFFQFLFSDEKEMGISGPGGVGKTFVMGQMVDEIMPQYLQTCKLMGIEPRYTSVMMTATTNKAAEQLSAFTGRDCPTIQSFLNLKVSDDFQTGQSKLTKKETWVVHEDMIIFVDECSMEDRALYAHIHAGTANCKIVHVGDHCQLAPVMETSSPVYQKGIHFYVLNEPMRTKVPALHALNQQFRNTVETGIFQPIQLVPGIIDLFDAAQMEAAVDKQFAAQTNEAKILSYTNKQVAEYNNHIRGIRNLPPEYTVGELLVNSSAVHVKTEMLNTEKEVEILSLSKSSDYLEIETGVHLEFRKAILKTPTGRIFKDVPLPVDRDHHNSLIKHYGRTKNWRAYFTLKNFYPDLRPHDSSTVYKAQGSTYDIVFVDLTNISTCHNPNQVARMLYVALSRARFRVILYGELAPKYGGLTN